MRAGAAISCELERARCLERQTRRRDFGMLATTGIAAAFVPRFVRAGNTCPPASVSVVGGTSVSTACVPTAPSTY